MPDYCAMYGCLSNSRNKERSFFRFPKDESRCKKWLVASGRLDLMNKSAESLYTSYYVCDLHFNKSDRLKKNLKRNAVPTQNLPEDYLTRTKSSQTEYATSHQMLTRDIDSQTAASSVSDCSTQTTKYLSANSPRKRKLLTAFKAECKKRKILESQQECATQKKCGISPQLQQIISLHKHLNHKSRGNKYDNKLFALNIYFASPLAYKVLANTLNLPSERTLRRIKFDIGTKLCPNVMHCLKSKLEKLDEASKFCIISAKEISLKRNLNYQIHKDKIMGFHEIDGVQTAEPATRAYVIMARGIFSNWKQPLGYCFLAKSKNYNELRIWLDGLILKVLDIGFNVVAFVSDQGSIFFKLASEKNISVEKPYFFVGGKKIYNMFDVPHLMNSMRNHLLKHDFKFVDMDGNQMTAKWEDIKTFYDQDCKKAYRLAPKLTESHINPNNFEKMKVKYATQVFSQSVASGMSTYIECERLSQAAAGTVKFIDLMDKTFDVLNSSVVKDPNANKIAFADTPKQRQILDEFDHFLSTVTVINVDKKNVTNTVKCLKGWKITINSVRYLVTDLQSGGFRFLFTRRLNQDALENFFGSVRQQGGNCRKPTPIQFSRAFNKLFMTKLLQHSERKNCSDDLDKLLLDIDTPGLNRQSKVGEDGNVTTEFTKQSTTSLVVQTTDYRFDLPDKNAFVYVCGYLLNKCAELHKCEKIIQYMRSNDQLTDDFFFTSSKSFNHKKVLLINPPQSFVACVKVMDDRFKDLFQEKTLDSVGNRIFSALSDVILTDCCDCFPNTYLKKLFVRFRIYNTIKFNNRLLKDKSCRRKFLSVSNL